MVVCMCGCVRVYVCLHNLLHFHAVNPDSAKQVWLRINNDFRRSLNIISMHEPPSPWRCSQDNRPLNCCYSLHNHWIITLWQENVFVVSEKAALKQKSATLMHPICFPIAALTVVKHTEAWQKVFPIHALKGKHLLYILLTCSFTYMTASIFKDEIIQRLTDFI